MHHLLRLTLGVDAPELPFYDPQMLALEHQIAELKHHRRVHDELLAAWKKAFDACTDLPHAPSAHTVHTLFLSAFGGRRYLILIQADEPTSRAFAAELERQCSLLLATPSQGTKGTPC